MTNLKSQLEPALGDFRIYQTASGRDAYDLPESPIIAPDTSAPVRFLPEYDNILIAHRARSRILPEEHRKKVLLSAGRVVGTVLIDRFVGATWRVQKDIHSIILFIKLFEPQPQNCAQALHEEGNRLIQFFDEKSNRQAVVIGTYV